jgi:hypothetical protein
MTRGVGQRPGRLMGGGAGENRTRPCELNRLISSIDSGHRPVKYAGVGLERGLTYIDVIPDASI